jgi:hypothetical protein
MIMTKADAAVSHDQLFVSQDTHPDDRVNPQHKLLWFLTAEEVVGAPIDRVGFVEALIAPWGPSTANHPVLRDIVRGYLGFAGTSGINPDDMWRYTPEGKPYTLRHIMLVRRGMHLMQLAGFARPEELGLLVSDSGAIPDDVLVHVIAMATTWGLEITGLVLRARVRQELKLDFVLELMAITGRKDGTREILETTTPAEFLQWIIDYVTRPQDYRPVPARYTGFDSQEENTSKEEKDNEAAA